MQDVWQDRQPYLDIWCVRKSELIGACDLRTLATANGNT
ncbi:hypothetical protein Z948_2501 [Sulfitobacter donghicola DSW-25 = KCTC 12864 = JCM 14565]|nr:hypothetical protein Z948_2501 [Sulfitobacter donghicola DSW-25 = KCTC 12864 = JCM 14565]